MFKLEITETCLRTGYNTRVDKSFSSDDSLKDFLSLYLLDKNIPMSKFYSRNKSVSRGTLEGVKLFYTPTPGTRIYIWINVYEEKRLVT